jgi:lysophospholipase L1-like esterase
MTPISILRRPSFLLPIALASGAVVRIVAFWRGVAKARALAAAGQRFERRQLSQGYSILVLGDSTGVGVGARHPEKSTAGGWPPSSRDADIVNVSVSGARVCDTLAHASEWIGTNCRFDLAVLHVGANDIVRATSKEKLANDCDALLVELKKVTDRLIWLGPANVGLARLVPASILMAVSGALPRAATIFADSAARHWVAFVDFCGSEHGQHLRRGGRQHFAVDGFHPNSSTYGHGYSAVRGDITQSCSTLRKCRTQVRREP